MKIAIIGGGAAGMICAYLLDKAGHAITVLEKQAILGGHIRTTNKNVKTPELKDHLFLEGGVVEFSAKFHHFRTLMEELGIKLEPVNIGTGLFLKDGSRYLSRIMIRQNANGFQKINEYFKFFSLQTAAFDGWLKTRNGKTDHLKNKSMEDFLPRKSIGATWLKNFSMYSYSIPFVHIDKFPVELGIPSIKDYMLAGWFRIPGGVYSYIEKIASRFSGTIILNANVQNINRSKETVNLHWNNHQQEYFDKVIFATPPDQVLTLLKDATKEEQRRFGGWTANHAKTIIHSDDHFYKPYNIKHPSAFDFFQTPKGWAYNAYLNQLCNIKEDTPYFLSFNMESLIKPEKIVHIQEHHTPFYTVDAFQYRDEIIKTNGQHHTFHVGAYLGDGLHEGAVLSAKRVVELLS